MIFVKPKMNKCSEYIYINNNYGENMKTIKLTKNQLKILRHCLGEYDQFLCGVDDDQIKEHKEKHGRNLADNLKKLENKLYG